VRCASAGAERRGGGLCADPAYVVIPQEKKKKKEVKKCAGTKHLSHWHRRLVVRKEPGKVNEQGACPSSTFAIER
jgi:hypothetical protein